MIIKSKDKIAGLPALKVRKFLKYAKEFDSFTAGLATKNLRITKEESQVFLKKLSALKFIKKIKTSKNLPPEWAITSKGMILSEASARPIKRQNAEKQVQEFLKRVDIVNKDPSFIYRVSIVILFGSFLGKKHEVGDIDVAIDLMAKESDSAKHHSLCEKKMKDASLAGKKFSSWFDALAWPYQEVWKFLKSQSRGLHLHSYSIHSDLLEKTPHRIIFQNNQWL